MGNNELFRDDIEFANALVEDAVISARERKQGQEEQEQEWIHCYQKQIIKKSINLWGILTLLILVGITIGVNITVVAYRGNKNMNSFQETIDAPTDGGLNFGAALVVSEDSTSSSLQLKNNINQSSFLVNENESIEQDGIR